MHLLQHHPDRGMHPVDTWVPLAAERTEHHHFALCLPVTGAVLGRLVALKIFAAAVFAAAGFRPSWRSLLRMARYLAGMDQSFGK
jgi:hypothetical protein